jgi:di/tricarboxylate transporter
MSGHAWLTLGVVLFSGILLWRSLFSAATVLMGAMVSLLVGGVITPEQALSGFSNPAPITVGALYVIARAARNTGLLSVVVSRLLDPARSQRSALARLGGATAVGSAFLNNTPLVAATTPQLISWAEARGHAPSRYLMPLSFSAILGGLCTLAGSSTNIVVSGLLETAGLPGLRFFELTPAGAAVAASGLLLIVLLAPALLPDRRVLHDIARRSREFVVSMSVDAGGALDGLSVSAAGLRHLQGVFLVQIERDDEVIAPVGPDTHLHGNDRLSFAGNVEQVLDIQSKAGLSLISDESQPLAPIKSTTSYYEAVVGQASPLIGQTIREIGFRGRYQAAVLALHRAGHRLKGKLGDARLRVGDTLVLLSDPAFAARWESREDFILIRSLGRTTPRQQRGVLSMLALLALVVTLVTTGHLAFVSAALLGAVGVILLGLVTPTEASKSVDVDVVVMLGAGFGIAQALLVSGLADVLAGGIITACGGLGPRGALLGVVLATLLLTELITNNAAALLVFPIAESVAQTLGQPLRPFAIAVTLSASSSFLTPLGYQTNMMVYGPGGYHFGDYVRLGLPVTALVVALNVWLVPLLWPFQG